MRHDPRCDPGSRLRAPAVVEAVKAKQVDRPGTRAAVGRGSAYDLHLTRELKAATLVRAPTSPAVIDLFLSQQLESDATRVGGELGKAMKDAGIAGDVGLATGYVLRFSNGLVAYLSGDTGVTAGPVESAFVMNELVKPASVIASHVNEVGTVGGKVRPGSKTEAFVKLAKMPAHLPLSGRTMAFDAAGKCVAGC